MRLFKYMLALLLLSFQLYADTVRLREVTFEGVDEEIVEDVKRYLSLREGQSIDEKMLSLLKDRLLEIYRRKGYLKAHVNFQWKGLEEEKADLIVRFDPGRAVIVTKITLTGIPSKEVKPVKARLAIQEGAVLDQKALDDSIDILSRYFRDNEYKSAVVDPPSVNLSADQSQAEVKYNIRTGERVRYQFSGNTIYSSIRLSEFLTPETLSRRDAHTRIINAMELLYRQSGYHFVKVRVEEKREPSNPVHLITFAVEEGPKVIIDHLNFRCPLRGDVPEAAQLFKRGSKGVLRNGVYFEEGIEESIKGMKAELSKWGYLNSSISSPRVFFTEDRKGVELVFDCEFGTQTRIEQVHFSGIQPDKMEAIEDFHSLESKEPLNPAEVQTLRNKILELYRKEGYLDVKMGGAGGENGIEMQGQQSQAVVHLDVIEGPRYRVGKITIEGLQKTEPIVVEREFRFKTGDFFKPPLILETEEELSLLGIFSSVEVRPVNSTDSNYTKDIRVILTEIKPGIGEIGIGGLYEEPRFRIRTFGELGYRNIFGLNHSATVNAQVTFPLSQRNNALIVPFIEYTTILAYRAPYPMDLPFAYVGQASLDSFEVSTKGPTLLTRARIENRIEKRFSKKLTGIYRLHRFDRTRTEVFVPNTDNLESSKIDRIGSTGPGVLVDLRDDVFNPTKGSFHTIDMEFAHPVLLSQTEPDRIGFLQVVSRNTFFFPLIDPFSFTIYMGTSYARSIFDGVGLPTARLTSDLALGGQTSIRGFSPGIFQASTRNPRPSELILYNVRAELSCYLFNNLSAAIFFDRGQLFPDMKPDRVHDGVGFGIRYRTPVGPVVLDIAQGLGDDRESVKFYFTIGTL